MCVCERERKENKNERFSKTLTKVFLPGVDVASLVLLGGMSSVSSTAVNEGLRLLIKILQNSEKSHDSHLTVLCKQVNRPH